MPMNLFGVAAGTQDCNYKHKRAINCETDNDGSDFWKEEVICLL